MSSGEGVQGVARVVFVDDHAANKPLYEAIAAQLPGHRVSFFDAGQAALDWAVSNTAALVVVDYSMPSMNGVEFVRRLRAVEGWKQVPVIMLTGMNSALVRESALDAGVNVFLTKPIQKHRFLQEARNLLGGAELRP